MHSNCPMWDSMMAWNAWRQTAWLMGLWQLAWLGDQVPEFSPLHTRFAVLFLLKIMSNTPEQQTHLVVALCQMGPLKEFPAISLTSRLSTQPWCPGCFSSGIGMGLRAISFQGILNGLECRVEVKCACATLWQPVLWSLHKVLPAKTDCVLYKHSIYSIKAKFILLVHTSMHFDKRTGA